ncbi:alpha/beta fold hydrolase [Georgenia ruanii]|uniref:Alpha/beta fold hydrolase n=1 Tax=Georgenia ruanii TaxID=348442 RepID=A0A7J9UTD4_9MICO|nr:alpha/beta fold hydrolase [Georgenia ruanii]MPV87885.1 alpha/beta fold hydrolase [Georgenia ruanii]
MGATQWIERPGGRVAYDVEGEGPLVVLVPGMGDLRQEYRYLGPQLLAAGYRVATTDLRGHGDSDAGFDAYGDIPTAEDVLALADALSPDAPVVLVGNSMGAAAVCWAAAERPDRVAGLVLLGPVARDVPMSPVLGWLMRAALTRPWGPAVWPAYQQSLFAGRPPADHATHRARIRASLRDPARWRAFRATVTTLTHAPVAARLGEIGAPALVVMGGKDPDFKDPAAEAAWLGETLGAEVLVRPASGHYPHADDPTAVGPAVTAFLARLALRADA